MIELPYPVWGMHMFYRDRDMNAQHPWFNLWNPCCVYSIMRTLSVPKQLWNSEEMLESFAKSLDISFNYILALSKSRYNMIWHDNTWSKNTPLFLFGKHQQCPDSSHPPCLLCDNPSARFGASTGLFVQGGAVHFIILSIIKYECSM